MRKWLNFCTASLPAWPEAPFTGSHRIAVYKLKLRAVLCNHFSQLGPLWRSRFSKTVSISQIAGVVRKAKDMECFVGYSTQQAFHISVPSPAFWYLSFPIPCCTWFYVIMKTRNLFEINGNLNTFSSEFCVSWIAAALSRDPADVQSWHNFSWELINLFWLLPSYWH